MRLVAKVIGKSGGELHRMLVNLQSAEFILRAAGDGRPWVREGKAI